MSISWSTTSAAKDGDTVKPTCTELETVIADLLSGQYKNRVAVNTAEKWSRDVAHELRHRCDEQMRDVPFGLEEFMDPHEGRYHNVQLPLPLRLV
jgi:hypothetical protein